jgi:hypothetical protein
MYRILMHRLIPRSSARIGLIIAFTLWGFEVFAQLVQLQNPQTDFVQAGFSIGQTIDNVTTGVNGWAVDPQEGQNHWVTFETSYNAGQPGTTWTFNLIQNFNVGGNGNHRLGHFRLEYTTDPRGNFANWTAVVPTSWSTVNGTVLTVQGDGSLFASGRDLTGPPASDPPTGGPLTDTYIISAPLIDGGITGLRLWALADLSLPANGPGTRGNGNFVLSEFTAVPEPSAYGVAGVLAMLGLTACASLRRKKMA